MNRICNIYQLYLLIIINTDLRSSYAKNWAVYNKIQLQCQLFCFHFYLPAMTIRLYYFSLGYIRNKRDVSEWTRIVRIRINKLDNGDTKWCVAFYGRPFNAKPITEMIYLQCYCIRLLLDEMMLWQISKVFFLRFCFPVSSQSKMHLKQYLV